MKLEPKRWVIGLLLTALITTGGKVLAAGDYLLATASTGGTYYPVGVALSTLVKVKLMPKQNINMSAINSAGSAENVKLLRDNEVQFAILQGLYGYYARTGRPIGKAGAEYRSACSDYAVEKR